MNNNNQVRRVFSDADNLCNQDPITISSLISECKCDNHTDCNDRSVMLVDDAICSWNCHQNDMKIWTLAQEWDPEANVLVESSSSSEATKENGLQ